MRHYCLVRGRLNKVVGLISIYVLAVLSATEAKAQPQTAPAITVTVNKSMVFRLAEKAKRVSVSQPQVADVLVVAPSQLLINGKAVGTTSLIIFDEKGEVSNYDLIVAPDVAAMRNQLRSIFPNEKVEISTSGPSIVLRGEVSNETVYDKVLEVAITYLPPKPPATITPSSTTITTTVNPGRAQISTSGSGFAGGGQIAFEDTADLSSLYRFPDKGKIEGVVDLLTIKEIRQIELDVIVAEVSMTKAREVGFNLRYDGPNQVRGITSALGSVSDAGTNPEVAFPAFLGAPTGAFTWVNGAHSLVALYRMLQNKDIAEVLAQPRLVIKNGRSGGFMSGGEFPIVQTLANSSTVEFKPFGVRLDFVPTITWSGRIDLRVFPEVSEPNASLPSQFGAALSVKRTVSRVEMADGESLIIGGLLDRRIIKDLAKVPILGDVPILGTLFRSTKFENRESELIFVITPRIVRTMKPGEKPALPSIEKFDDPDIRQVPVPGQDRRPARGASIP
jgi:pilus assembly protein CpaC